MSAEKIAASDRTIQISNPDKMFFPDDGITKRDLVIYYQRIANTMIGYLRGRPLAAERYPDGITGQRIFHKNVPGHFPDWIRRIEIPKRDGGTTTHAICDDAASLVYLANQACVTPHVWLSTADKLDQPDRLIFDLDPSTQDLGLLRSTAQTVREVFDELGLVPFLMTTGSRGYHVVAPLRREHTFAQTREFAHALATMLSEHEPQKVTIEHRKEKRGNRIFLDYLRNGYAQTTVAPYAVRAKPGAPVATPLHWDELDTTDPAQFTINSVQDRLDDGGDAWASFSNRARALHEPIRRLERLRSG